MENEKLIRELERVIECEQKTVNKLHDEFIHSEAYHKGIIDGIGLAISRLSHQEKEEINADSNQ